MRGEKCSNVTDSFLNKSFCDCFCLCFLSFFSRCPAVGRQLVTWLGQTVQSCPVGSVAPGDLIWPTWHTTEAASGQSNERQNDDDDDDNNNREPSGGFSFCCCSLRLCQYGCIQAFTQEDFIKPHSHFIKQLPGTTTVWCPLPPPSGQLLNFNFY